LPKMGGLDVLKSIRSHAAIEKTPVVVLTARGQQYDRQLALELKADGFITKPYANQDVIAEVRRMLVVYHVYAAIASGSARQTRRFGSLNTAFRYHIFDANFGKSLSDEYPYIRRPIGYDLSLYSLGVADMRRCRNVLLASSYWNHRSG